MSNVIKMVTGDPSGDGHECTGVFIYVTDASPSEVMTAARYARNNFDMFDEYGENSVTREYWSDVIAPKLSALGLKTSADYWFECDESYIWEAGMYNDFIKAIIEKMVGHTLTPMKMTKIEVGGYGLFH